MLSLIKIVWHSKETHSNLKENCPFGNVALDSTKKYRHSGRQMQLQGPKSSAIFQ